MGTVYMKLVMTTFFWGGTFVAGKWAVGEAPPFFVADGRITAPCSGAGTRAPLRDLPTSSSGRG